MVLVRLGELLKFGTHGLNLLTKSLDFTVHYHEVLRGSRIG